MHYKLFYILTALAFAKFPPRKTVKLENLHAQTLGEDILKITYGSCYGIQDRRSDIFKDVIGVETPDLFIWGGDAVYADKFEAIFMADNEGWRPIDEVKH
jgi:hypothetical protein